MGMHRDDATGEGMRPDLRRRIEAVARQCRRRRAMACWIRFGVSTLALTLLFTLLLAIFTPDGPLGATLAVIFVVCQVIATWWFLLAPLRKSISLEQVALYIDERHPELENRIISAVEFSTSEQTGASTWIIERFLEDTAPMLRETSLTDVMSGGGLPRIFTLAFGGVAASLAVILVFNGLWLPSISLFVPAGMIGERSSLPFTVQPGNKRVRRGDNEMIWVRSDKPNRKVSIRWRVADGEWRGEDMNQSSSEETHYRQFTNVQADIEYQVQFGRRRSEVFQLTAWSPPAIDTIDLTYHYPEYLGRGPQEVPNSGNISAIEGTRVEMSVWVNKRLSGAEMVLGSGDRIPLEEKSDGLWTIPITLAKNDTYRIELKDLEDASSEYDAEYRIQTHRDKAPEIKINFPRGDEEVTMLEEVPFDFKVTDDYGFNEYGIQYEIAGEEPVKVALHTGDEMVTEASGHHEIMLEELGLEVGDLITWTVWAKDTKPDRDEYEALGDPYFIDIRPFLKTYREAVSGGGGGGGGGGEGGEPDEMQRDVIIATWNLRREASYLDETEFNRRRDIIVDTQLEVGAAAARAEQGGDIDLALSRQLNDAITQALDALRGASFPDPKVDLTEAARKEEVARKMLLKLRPRESEVRQEQEGGGGGGGGGGAGQGQVDELELEQNKNFYEQQNLTQEQQEAADQVVNKIKELAQRQQTVNEEIAKLVSELQKANSDEERERIRRELERLEEELQQNLERLDDIQQDVSSGQMNNEQTREAQESVRQAREQMNRSLEQLGNDELQQAKASGERAMQALADLEEELSQFTRDFAAQRMQQLLERMEALQKNQKEILAQAESLQAQHNSPSMDGQEEAEAATDALAQDKTELAEEFTGMMEEAADLAERARQTQELMSRKLGDWLRETSREGILEDITESAQYVRYGIWDAAVAEEEKIELKIAKATDGLRRVADNLTEDELEALQKALEQVDAILNDQEAAPGVGQGQEDPLQQMQVTQRGEEGEGQQGEGQGKGEGEQQGQGEGEGEQQGQGQGQQSQQAQGQGQGGGGGGSADGQPGSRSQVAQSGNRFGNPSRGGGGGGGPEDWDGSMQQFVEEGYREWVDRLRDAEALLPQESAQRNRLIRIRENVQGMRQEWRERSLAPEFDMYLEHAVDPLREVAVELQREIERKMGESEFLLVDEGDIPERYKKQVAEYFKQLSESEGSS